LDSSFPKKKQAKQKAKKNKKTKKMTEMLRIVLQSLAETVKLSLLLHVLIWLVGLAMVVLMEIAGMDLECSVVWLQKVQRSGQPFRCARAMQFVWQSVRLTCSAWLLACIRCVLWTEHKAEVCAQALSLTWGILKVRVKNRVPCLSRSDDQEEEMTGPEEEHIKQDELTDWTEHDWDSKAWLNESLQSALQTLDAMEIPASEKTTNDKWPKLGRTDLTDYGMSLRSSNSPGSPGNS
jgi:hypothetical protein